MNTAELAPDGARARPRPSLVSIVVKTLNEEHNIARTLSSIDAATRGLPVEVIVADSLSTDRTVEIALRHGAKVVQLIDPTERCCGVGAQLGFQVARGEFVMILDGDMELVVGFIEQALDAFGCDSRLAGVGGQIVEMSVENRVFVNRLQHNRALTAIGDVDRLDMGGLYRAAALNGVGYFTHRGLHSCEELELGCRLKADNWRLARLATPSIRHWGHTLPRYVLLLRRIRSRYFLGPGELLRSSLGRPWLRRTLKAFRAYLAMVFLWAFGLLSITLLPFAVWPFVSFLAIVFLLIARASVKRSSISDGVYGFIAWNVYGIGLLRGFCRPTIDPMVPVRHRCLG